MLFSFDPYKILSTLIVSLAIQAVFVAFAASFKTDKSTDLSYSLSFASRLGTYLLLLMPPRKEARGA